MLSDEYAKTGACHIIRSAEAFQQPRSGLRCQDANLEPKKDILRKRRQLNLIRQYRFPRRVSELNGEVLIFKHIAFKTVHRHLRGYGPNGRDTSAAFPGAYVHESRARAVGGRLRSNC